MLYYIKSKFGPVLFKELQILQFATKLLSEQLYQFEYFLLFVPMTINCIGFMLSWPNHGGKVVEKLVNWAEIKSSKSQQVITTMMIITTIYWSLTMRGSEVITLSDLILSTNLNKRHWYPASQIRNWRVQRFCPRPPACSYQNKNSNEASLTLPPLLRSARLRTKLSLL